MIVSLHLLKLWQIALIILSNNMNNSITNNNNDKNKILIVEMTAQMR
jgi:hypothetical protein